MIVRKLRYYLMKYVVKFIFTDYAKHFPTSKEPKTPQKKKTIFTPWVTQSISEPM